MNTATQRNIELETLDRFFTRLAKTPQCVLLLDYDGTLAPFHTDPAKAVPYPGVIEAIDAIQDQSDTRVVLISGRWTNDLVPLIPFRHMPEIWGSHGWELRRTDGQIEMPDLPEQARQGLAEASTMCDALIALGARCEFKPASLAIHWRGLQPARIEQIANNVRDHWVLSVRQFGIELHPFDGGLELRIPGRDKGYVVRRLRRETPGALIAYLGDDLTDEDAFRSLDPVDLGVLVRTEYRQTAARAWLRPPEQLLDFLHRWKTVRDPHATAR